MSIFDPNAGFTGTPDPLRFAWGQQAIADARRAAQGASLDLWPDADFLFIDPLTGGLLTGDPQLPQAIEDVATVTRASKSWTAGWSGVNGDPAGSLIEHALGKATWSPYGLKVESGAENLITNPRGEGPALPSVPSAWDIGGAGGSISVTGRGIDDGWPHIDVTFDGTLSGYVTPGYISALAGETITGTFGVALISGSCPASPVNFQLFADGATVGPASVVSIKPDHRRFSATHTLAANATSVSFVGFVQAGVYANAVLRFYTPTLTKTDYPPNPVLPPVGVTGAALRTDESVSVPVSLGWYRHDEGTLIVEYTRPMRPGGFGIVAFPEPANEAFGRAIRNATNSTVVRSDVGTLAGVVTSGEEVAIAAGRHLTALRWAGTVHRSATDGTLGTGFTHGAAVVAPQKLVLGAGGLNQGTVTASSTLIHRVRFFPRALTDAEMIEITTPYWSA